MRLGSLRLRGKEHADELLSLDGPDVSLGPDGAAYPQHPCCCSTCRNYTRAYLHALLRDHSTEALAAQLITCHNVAYMMGLMRSLREVHIVCT